MRATALAVLAFVNLACASGSDSRKTPRIPEGPVALRYRTLDGDWQTLGRLRGRVVVVHVFTTWSDPSLVEIPRLSALARRYPERVSVVGLSADAEPEATRVFAETFDVPYTVGRVPDPASFMGPDGPFGPIGIIPTSVVLDPSGRIAARADGMWAKGVLEAVVGRLLRTSS